MPADRRNEWRRQLDGEHRRRGGHLDIPGAAGALHVPVCLPRRTAEPGGEQPTGIRRRDTRIRQVSGSIDPLGELVATSATRASRATPSQVTNVLLDMSAGLSDTPRPLRTAVAQRHFETEVAHCVGGVRMPPWGVPVMVSWRSRRARAGSAETHRSTDESPPRRWAPAPVSAQVELPDPRWSGRCVHTAVLSRWCAVLTCSGNL
jgi:hypothetical protein